MRRGCAPTGRPATRDRRRPHGFALAWLLLVALAACGDPAMQPLTGWQLRQGSGAPRTVELPGNLERLVASEPGRYTLRARVVIDAPLRGRDLTLIVPAFDGLVTARVDGAAATPAGLELPRGYRQPGPHRFEIAGSASTDGVLDVELVVDHRWTGSAWFGAAPRLVVAGTTDALTWAVWAFNLVVTVCALVALFQIGITSATVYFTDRRRRPYLLFGIQALTAMVYPLHIVGVTQLVFGRFDVAVLGLTLSIAICVSVYFTHAFFDLPRPRRVFAVGLGLIAVPALSFCASFDAVRYIGPPVIAYLGAVALYQVVRCTLLYRQGRDRRSARYLLLSWAVLAISCVPDLVAWTGVLDPLHGVRVASVGLGLFALWQSLLFSQRHILTMAESDHKGDELAQRVAELERHRTEIEQLNTELRRQLSDKSQQIYAALTLSTDRAAGSPRVKIGDLIDQRYRIERLLGSGGMGDVFEVSRTSDDKRFALKLTHDVSGVALARLAREAVVALTVDHDNVVKVVDVDVATAGFLFIVMELVQGAPLRQRSRDKHDIAWICDVLHQTARGLAAIHAAGIVHRDLKPANVLLTEATDGRVHVKISDFGISLGRDMREAGLAEPGAGAHAEPVDPSEAALDDDAPTEALPGDTTVTMPVRGARDARQPRAMHRLTRTGLLPGTPAYIAPELVQGRTNITAAADLFAFGVIAYELLTRTRPFREPPALALLAGRRVQWPAPLAQAHAAVPPGLATLVDRCLAERPQARPTALEVARQLEQLERELRPAATDPAE